MNDRERISEILDGRAPDRIPWVPRLKLWYQARRLTETLPKQWEGYSLREVARALGAGTSAREGKVFDIEIDETDRAIAGDRLGAMCEKLLANTVIENYQIEIV